MNIPYYHVISENKDITFKPTIFDTDIYMFQNEYRQENKKSSFITDIGLTKGYSSSIQDSKKNNLGHFFSKFDLDLGLTSFIKSKLEVSIEKISLDTYLKIFDANLTDIEAASGSTFLDKCYAWVMAQDDMSGSTAV